MERGRVLPTGSLEADGHSQAAARGTASSSDTAPPPDTGASLATAALTATALPACILPADRNRLSRCLAPLDVPGASALRVRGDHDLNPGLGPPGAVRDAAVLVPLVQRDDGLTVLLTQRTAHLSAHAGQISFPGGAVEETDPDHLAAALRETEEEIGLGAQLIDVLGRLDTYVIRTGFRVTPYVGLIQPPFDLRPAPEEVADVFEVPLDFILHPDNPQRHSRLYQGQQRHYLVFPYEDRYIWGATAGMLFNLREALAGLAD